MPARLFPYAFLLLFGAVSISVSTGQDLHYDQDLIPEPSEDIALQYLTRVLKARNQNGPYGQVFLPPHHLQELKANQQLREQRRAEFLSVFRGRFDPFPKKSDLLQRSNERSLLDLLNPHGLIHTRPGYQDPLIAPQTPSRGREYPTLPDWPSHRNSIAPETGMKEEPSADINHRFLTIGRQNLGQHSSHADHSGTVNGKHSDFTFELHVPSPREKDHWVPFSGPGEPEFDLDEESSTRFTEAEAGLENEERTEKISQANNGDVGTNLNQAEFSKQVTSFNSPPNPEKIPEDNDGILEDDYDDDHEGSAGILPELQRRADSHGPMITSVDHSIGKDIYFVAVVAGCSAAAMFVLVLISLTWCRFQRGAKAAADVEYPAYGVTGPNKDTSPSGDRRLAQSAQMYHYQHQKQQIIAMESRTATGRDPGSVSEAESDEENEEGDYTVYECPGLAPTGEMEVKNPLFHDDPTPATPAGPGQSSRSSEDQNM